VRFRTEDELNTLARDIFEGRAIISFQISPEALAEVFLPLKFAAEEDMKILGVQCGAFFEYLPTSGRMDGPYPVLNSVQYLHVDDVDALAAEHLRLKRIHERRAPSPKNHKITRRMKLKKAKKETS